MNALQLCLWQFSHRCYGWGATSKNRAKIDDLAPTRSIWSKISGTRSRPHQSFFHGWLGQWMPYNFAADSFHTKKLSSRLSPCSFSSIPIHPRRTPFPSPQNVIPSTPVPEKFLWSPSPISMQVSSTHCTAVVTSSCQRASEMTRSSATANSTARASCLVGVLYEISPEKICWWLINHWLPFPR